MSPACQTVSKADEKSIKQAYTCLCLRLKSSIIAFYKTTLSEVL